MVTEFLGLTEEVPKKQDVEPSNAAQKHLTDGYNLNSSHVAYNRTGRVEVREIM